VGNRKGEKRGSVPEDFAKKEGKAHRFPIKKKGKSIILGPVRGKEGEGAILAAIGRGEKEETSGVRGLDGCNMVRKNEGLPAGEGRGGKKGGRGWGVYLQCFISLRGEKDRMSTLVFPMFWQSKGKKGVRTTFNLVRGGGKGERGLCLSYFREKKRKWCKVNYL